MLKPIIWKSLMCLSLALLAACSTVPAPLSTPLPTSTARPTSTLLPTPTPVPASTSEHIPTPLSARPQIREDYAQALNLDRQAYPRIDGSTSTEPLQVQILCTLYELYCPWLKRSESNAAAELTPLMIMENGDWHGLDRSALPITDHTGTHTAHLNLINGEADLILEARLPSADEVQVAQEKKVELETTVIALDAFVFLTHADNPVDSLSLQQIRDIYSGQLTNWSQVGGLDLPITPYQREENSGSQELMEALVMHDLPFVKADDLIAYTMAGPFNALNDNPTKFPMGDTRKAWPQGDVSGIAYTVYYYERNIAPRYENIKVLAVEGVRPTQVTIAERTYPLVSEVYVVVRAGTPADSATIRLRDWLASKGEYRNDGQRTVEQSGYVPYQELP
ncbi:Phosphate-binding protein PstS 1 [Thermoflexales bacterium]|nr:Phosphate-binding protein PstS 1 [Thermoflexales bacterium]